MPNEVKPEDLPIDSIVAHGKVWISAVDVAYFISVTEDAELAPGSSSGYRRWELSQRDAIAAVIGKIRSRICGKAAGR